MLRHGGNLTNSARVSGLAPEQILDFSANINPLGPPEWLRSVVSSALGSVVHYPDPECSGLVEAVAARYEVRPDQVLVGNGSTEILHLLPRSLDVSRAVICVPTYTDYELSATLAGLEVTRIFLQENEGFQLHLPRLASRMRGDELVFLCRPNNPTGLLFDAEALRGIAAKFPSAIFVVDEAFGDFVDGMDSMTRERPDNVVVLLSLTKIFAIPGLRLGCAIADHRVVEGVRRIQPYWSVNTVAQAVGEAALKDTQYRERSREFVRETRQNLVADLNAIPHVKAYQGTANFLLARIEHKDMDATILAERMLRDGIAIRVCENFDGLDKRFFRVAVRTTRENLRMCDAIRSALGIARQVRTRRRSLALMFQGTSSNAGKSVLTAALGRILLQDGYRVAPFKSQNMSLNSFVTRTGGEMGRAQVVQAQACRLDPDVRMNPILLKPNTDTGSQVIVCGKPVGNMNVSEYIEYKPTAFEEAKAAYESLAREFEVIVIEGAGSPGEVNLKHHDIVNMQMARYANAPVLLVGDIDRGGVFAAFVGTMEVLAEWERSMVAGFVVNRFRGKQDLLGDAIEYTRRHTGRPVLGVVPYLPDLGLPEEDSVSFKNGHFDDSGPSEDYVEIAVIDLPHISNFTDFDPFRIEPDVRLTVVRTPGDLNRPNAVILPGSKNVIGDLEYLRHNGLAAKITDLIRNYRTELVGICGGFQMLGHGIADVHHLESAGKTIRGLGLLNLTTVLALEKTLTRVKAEHLESGLTVRGYEIHHGQSESSNIEPLLKLEHTGPEGARSSDGMLWGTYLHGIFDTDEFRRWFIDRLRTRRGLAAKGRVCGEYDLEPALDRLAESVRRNIRMDTVYKLMGL